MQRREFLYRGARVAAALVLAAACPRPAWAFLVFDPINYVETLVSAINAVKQTWAQYEQLRQQLMQLAQEAKQLQSMDPAAAARMLAGTPAARDLDTLEAATTATSDLAGSLQVVRRNFAQRLDEARLANRSWADYDRVWNQQLARRAQAALARVSAEKAAEQQVTRDFEAARELGGRISGTAGTHEAQQLMNLQLNRLLQQHALLNQQLAKYLGGHEAEKMQLDMEDAEQVKAGVDDARARMAAEESVDRTALQAWADSVRGRGMSPMSQPSGTSQASAAPGVPR